MTIIAYHGFWETHSIWFVLAMFFFPRLTMLFATTFGSGVLYWVGWMLAPKLTVAVIAASLYWETDPYLVLFAFIWCLLGSDYDYHSLSRIRRNGSDAS